MHLTLKQEATRPTGMINRKRVHRLYRLEGLQVPMRVRRRKRLSLHRGPVPRPTAANQHWSMDFVHDQLLDGRRFRVLTVIDQWSRESVSVEPGYSLNGQGVADILDQVAQRRPLPKASPWITGPNSPREHWTNGRGSVACNSTLFGRESPSRTGFASRLTAGSAMNA